MQLEDWLDDLCVRFIINLPPEELASVERICFQVEEAQWFYEDFIRPLDPSLPSLSLKQFSLRIFQHCPLFSQWSAQHHTTAFAEFLAYKQRVPVRGAIMLSEAMDEVVLVKGWKKGANWSFPRGKINKDESDLDCAVREVYEETGFDIKAAGLVKPEKEMKYIEVTMREQHMRLYVFRGVPRDTYFEPRTRKEISKIEWYKLTDLPTIKKKVHHENEEHPAINANKFYMVAPFLHPLKKWISQQRKQEGRYSGSALAVPPILAEDSATETETVPASIVPQSHAYANQNLSSLPEVLPLQPHHINPSGQLKDLLHIGRPVIEPVSNVEQPGQTAHVPGADSAKSNALLALLRGGPVTAPHQTAQPMSQQIHSQPQMATSAELLLPGMTLLPQHQAQPQPHQLDLNTAQQSNQDSLLSLFSSVPPIRAQRVDQPTSRTASNAAPYQQTGDPQFASDASDRTAVPAVPPANALPKLTHHTRALLGAFHGSQLEPKNTPAHLQPPQKSLLDLLRGPQTGPTPANISDREDIIEPKELPGQSQFKSATPRLSDKASPAQAMSLLGLLRGPGNASQTASHPSIAQQQAAPVELAAAPVNTASTPAELSQSEVLAALFRKDKPGQATRARSPTAKTGQTSATITVPLNQPSLEVFNKSAKGSDHDKRRSPAPVHRTLFDPKQPAPMKILARPESKHGSQPRSPRLQKSGQVSSSPKRNAKAQEKVQDKPFQPQILKRPQGPDSRQSLSPSPSSFVPLGSRQPSRRPSNMISSTPSPGQEYPSGDATPQLQTSRRPSGQADPHKQTLLQLFGGTSPLMTSPVSQVPARKVSAISGIVSPTTPSQLVSPLVDEPISTRSRVGSLASISSGFPGPSITGGPDGRPKAEKRQTAAEDKAFLLGYLGRLANQDS